MKKIVTLALTTALLTSTAPLAYADSGVSAGTDANAGVNVETNSGDVNAGTGVDAGATVSSDDNGSGVSADTDVDASGDMSADSSATDSASGGADASVALTSKADIEAAISGVDSADDVTIIAWSDVEGSASPDLKVFDTADASGQADLDAMVEANATLMTALEDEGFDADQVVAIRAAADGSVKLYVNDKA